MLVAGILVPCFSQSALFAATLDVIIQGSGAKTTGFPVTDSLVIEPDFSEQFSDQASQVELSNSFSGAGNFGTASGSASASADADKGELKFSVLAARTAPPCSTGPNGCLPSSQTLAFVQIIEEFTVSGTGTLTALMDYDVLWDATRFDFAAGVSISPTGFTNSAGDNFNTDNSASVGSNEGILDASIFLNGVVSETVTMSWLIQGTATAGETAFSANVMSMIDASNTGRIFFEASNGLTVTPASSDFLANATFRQDTTMAPVPVPASLPLLIGGLVCFGCIGRSRKRVA